VSQNDAIRQYKRGPAKGQRKSDRSRATILAAATKEFARKGFDGARIDQIALRSKANKNLIYLYFGNKDALFLAVLESVYLKLREAQDDPHVLSLDPVAGIREFVRSTFRGFLAAPDLISLAVSENVHRGAHLKTSPIIKKLYNRIAATLNKLYKKGLRQGQFRPGIDMIELYISIVSVCSYHISNQYTLSILLQTDLMADKRLDLREQHSTNMILRHLCVDADRIPVALP